MQIRTKYLPFGSFGGFRNSLQPAEGADLIRVIVVPQAPIRRRRDATLHGFRLERGKNLSAISHQSRRFDGIEGEGRLSFHMLPCRVSGVFELLVQSMLSLHFRFVECLTSHFDK